MYWLQPLCAKLSSKEYQYVAESPCIWKTCIFGMRCINFCPVNAILYNKKSVLRINVKTNHSCPRKCGDLIRGEVCEYDIAAVLLQGSDGCIRPIIRKSTRTFLTKINYISPVALNMVS